MSESFHEENVISLSPEKDKKRALLFSVSSVFSLIMGLLLIFLAYIGLMFSEVDESGKIVTSIIPLIVYALFGAGSIFLFFVLRRRRNDCILEFDYSFVSGSLRIAKVMNHIRRKPVIAIECSDIEAMDNVETDNFKRYETMKDVKKVVVTPNVGEEEARIIYIYGKFKGVSTLLLIEPSDMLLHLIKRSSRRVMFKR